jgi:hypothetical protein
MLVELVLRYKEFRSRLLCHICMGAISILSQDKSLTLSFPIIGDVICKISYYLNSVVAHWPKYVPIRTGVQGDTKAVKVLAPWADFQPILASVRDGSSWKCIDSTERSGSAAEHHVDEG